jgi:hypothetical protein
MEPSELDLTPDMKIGEDVSKTNHTIWFYGIHIWLCKGKKRRDASVPS